MGATRWIAAVLGLAGLHVAAGLAGVILALATGRSPSATIPLWVFPLQMLVFSGAAGVLVAGGRRDPRTLALACVFALIATQFARRPELLLEAQLGHPLVLVALRGLRVDALLPAFVWMFFREFPRSVATPRARAVARSGVAIATLGGVLLVAATLVLALAGEAAGPLRVLDPDDSSSPYWGFVYGLTFLALPFALYRARTAPLDERRRARLFAAGIAAAALPYSLFVLAGVVSRDFLAYALGPGHDLVVPFVELLILSIPITTAYAVVVERALPVRVMLRSALRYGLARGVVAAGVSLPFAWIVWYAWALRAEPLASLVSGPRGIAVLGAGAIGFAAVRARRVAQRTIDRTFFRDAYDARVTLLAVAENCRRVGGAAQLAELLASEIDRALHLERISVLFADPLGGELRPVVGALRALPAVAELALLLARNAEPLQVELDRDGSPFRTVSEEERQWLADGAVELLVPLLADENALIGLIALGAKRSELPFTREDRQLLAAIGAAGSLTLEARLKRDTPTVSLDQRHQDDRPAWVCEGCRCVVGESRGRCDSCSGRLVATPLPFVLLRKFRLERRVGEGGMGVVYLARDLDLDRPVAIKTLPRRSPEDAERLRREARAMAAVLHPNLAVVYAAESWKGTPLLVTEFLAGGTLAERILPARLEPDEVRSLGDALADALDRVHRAGILHRDLKPSNIGYTGDGVPKLLDFGLARVCDASSGAARPPPALIAESGSAPRRTVTQPGFIGTPLYMSPEAVRGELPDTTFDLWSLAVVLYEAISGRNPVERRSWAETYDAIQAGLTSDVREAAPWISAGVAAFFDDALHTDRRRRPSGAAEFRRRWQQAWAAS